MGSQMVGAVVLNTVKTFLYKQEQGTGNGELGTRNREQEIEGYVRFKVLFLKTDNQSLKIQIFKQKNQILQAVNLALEKVGYATRVEEIRMR